MIYSYYWKSFGFTATGKFFWDWFCAVFYWDVHYDDNKIMANFRSSHQWVQIFSITFSEVSSLLVFVHLLGKKITILPVFSVIETVMPYTAQKMKFSIMDFFSKCAPIRLTSWKGRFNLFHAALTAFKAGNIRKIYVILSLLNICRI